MNGVPVWPWLLAVVGIVFVTGCRTPTRLAPVDLSSTGWQVTETAAVWRPQRAAPELIGELLVAVNTDGARFVQFSKQGLPVITAQVSSQGWQISSPLRVGVHSGALPPPVRVLWFHLDGLPPRGSFRSPWRLVVDPSADRWTLDNQTTGESLEVVEATHPSPK